MLSSVKNTALVQGLSHSCVSVLCHQENTQDRTRETRFSFPPPLRRKEMEAVQGRGLWARQRKGQILEGRVKEEKGGGLLSSLSPSAIAWKNNGFSEALCRQGSSEKN